MNDRRGPLECVEIFTTTTIVIRRINAKNINVIWLLFEYINNILVDWLSDVGLNIFSEVNMIDMSVIKKNSIGLAESMICWFGVIATK